MLPDTLLQVMLNIYLVFGSVIFCPLHMVRIYTDYAKNVAGNDTLKFNVPFPTTCDIQNTPLSLLQSCGTRTLFDDLHVYSDQIINTSITYLDFAR